MVGSSSSSRCIAVLILSSSPRVLGSIAYDSTGSGKLVGAIARPPLSARVSLVSVSFNFATAPMSPAVSSGTVVGVLPCMTLRWPMRSPASRVRLWTLVSDLSVPVMTRNKVMRPANGSATVFHTKAVQGEVADGVRVTSAFAFVSVATNGRSAGDGT